MWLGLLIIPLPVPFINKLFQETFHALDAAQSAVLHGENKSINQASSAVFHFYKFGLCCFVSYVINVAPQLLRSLLCLGTLNEFNSFCDSQRPCANVCCSLYSTFPSSLVLSAFYPLITADTLPFSSICSPLRSLLLFCLHICFVTLFSSLHLPFALKC